MCSTAIHNGINKRIRKRNAVILGALLEQARAGIGLSQTDLAQRLGKKQSFVSKYEAGQRFLDLTEFIRICRELVVDPSEKLSQLEERGVGFPKERQTPGSNMRTITRRK